MKKTKMQIAVALVSSMMLTLCSPFSVSAAPTAIAPQIKNIIMMIPDGGAMAPFYLADAVKQDGGFDKTIYPYVTPVEKGEMYIKDYLVGAETTRSANEAITDSAAGGTALSSGYKTNNGYVGVDPNKKPRANILEVCQDMGKNTGIVVTYEWTNATPADYSAHDISRYNMKTMSEQIVNQGIDVVFGNTHSDFSNEAWFTDSALAERGYTVIKERTALKNVEAGDRVWGKLPPSYYDINCKEVNPTLVELTQTAIKALDDGNEKGFFLMVEGSAVDGGGHSNDAVNMVSEYLSFDAACKTAIEYAKGRTDTIVVIAPDHDTGGLSYNYDDIEKIVDEIQVGTNPESISWETKAHTARNGGVFMYLPEGVPYPEGIDPDKAPQVASDFYNTYGTFASSYPEDAVNVIDNTDIPKYIASLIGGDFAETTNKLFIDVTNQGTYDTETEMFTFADENIKIKRNASTALVDGKSVDLGGEIALYVEGNFYVPRQLVKNYRYRTSLTNLVSGGDMEGQNCSAYSFSSKYGSYETANGNTYYKVASTEAYRATAVLYIGDSELTDRKFRAIADVWTDDGTTHTDFGLGYVWSTVKAPATINGTKKTVDLSMTYDGTGKSVCFLIPQTDETLKTFSMDNLSLYDLTNAYKITTDDEITIDKASYALVGKDKMTNAGDTVRFEVGKPAEGYVITGVSVEGADVTEETDGSYTFTMPAADTKIVVTKEKLAYVTSLENLISGGDMEGQNSSVYAGNSEYGSYQTADGNTYYKVASTNASDPRAAVVLYRPDTAPTGRKFRAVADVWTDDGATHSDFGLGYAWNTVKAAATISGAKKTVDLSMTYEDTTVKSICLLIKSAGKKGFSMDNASIYDVTNAYKLIADEEIIINSASYALIGKDKMTNAGDTVRFEVGKPDEGYVITGVSVDGAEVTGASDGSYTFTMPASDTKIVVNKEKLAYVTSLENLITGGDMEGQNSSVYAGNSEYGSYQTVDGNTYYKVASTNASDPRAAVVLYAESPAPTGRTFRAVADVWTEDDATYTDFGIGYAWNKVKTFETIDGTKKTVDLSMLSDGTGKICFLIKSAGKKSFSMDNAAIYDVTNAYKLNADEEISINSASYALIGNDKMTNAGDTVKFTVGEPADGYVVTGVSVDGAEVTVAADGSYTFTMPASDTKIVVTKEKLAHATSLENLISGGDMEGQNSSVYAGNSEYGSYQTVDRNTYYKVASTNTSDPRAAVVLYRPDTAPTGRKFRVIADVWTEDNATYSDFGLGHAWNTVKAAATISGEKKTVDLSMTYVDTTVKSICLLIKSAGKKSFSMDNAAIYDVTNAYKLTADDEITIDSASYTVIGKDKMTNAGDTVRFEVGKPAEGYIITGVSVEGAEVTEESNGSYTFIMPAADTKIVVNKEKLAHRTSLENLISGGNMENENCSISIANLYNTLSWSYEEDNDGLYGKVLKVIDTRENGCITYFNSQIGHTYAVNANVKTDSKVDVYVASENFGKNRAIISTNSWARLSVEHTAIGEKTWIWHNAANNAMYLDDLSVYDITNAKRITAPEDVIIDPVSYIVYKGKKITNAGDVVKFTAPEGVIVKVNDEIITPDSDGSYTFTMPIIDAVITTQVKEVDIKEVNYDSKEAVISSLNSLSCIVFAASYDEYDNLLNVVSAPVTVAAGGTATIDLSAFDSIEGVRLFIWNNLTDIKPVTESYTIPAVQL